MKLHNAPKFALPIPEAPFNLAGEPVRESEPPKAAPAPDTQTREFPGLRGTFYLYELGALPEAKP